MLGKVADTDIGLLMGHLLISQKLNIAFY